jgi:hypothetical protein
MEPVAVALLRFEEDRRAELETRLERASAVLDPSWPCSVGWATVEIERAAAELAAIAEPAPADLLLGAHAALARRRGASALVLLEPSTEGLLAASLARFGEGPAVLYVSAGPVSVASFARAASRAGLVVSAGAAGPLGPSVLVAPGRPWGPHLVVAGDGQAGTIAR